MNYDPVACGAHCKICPLRGSKIIPPIPPAASRQPRLIVVGDNPSRADEKLGRGFEGMGGGLLKRTLAAAGVPVADVHLTNAALCRGETDKDNEKAAVCCAPRLLREVAAVAGTPILTLGRAPLISLLGTKKLGYARGFIWQAPTIERTAIKAAHRLASRSAEGPPAQRAVLRAETLDGRSRLAGATVLPSLSLHFIVRADTWKPVFEIDVRRAVRVADGLRIAAPWDGHTVGDLDGLRGMGPIVALDVETDGVKVLETGLLCVGISDGIRTHVIWPWRKRYAAPLSKWLRTREQVVCHNMAFDRGVLAAHGVK